MRDPNDTSTIATALRRDQVAEVAERVLAPDEATVERVAKVIHDKRHPVCVGPASDHDRNLARAVLAALAEDPAEVSP